MSQICEKKATGFARPELIEVLAWKSGLMYMSDLSFLRDRELRSERCQVLHTLRGTQAEQYPLREWNDAAAYVTGQGAAFETAETARAFLIHYLEGD